MGLLRQDLPGGGWVMRGPKWWARLVLGVSYQLSRRRCADCRQRSPLHLDVCVTVRRQTEARVKAAYERGIRSGRAGLLVELGAERAREKAGQPQPRSTP